MRRILFAIRYSVRSFTRTPGVTLALLLTIALGMGSNVSIHGFVVGLIQPKSPLARIDNVVSIFRRDARQGGGALSYEDYLFVKGRSHAFEWIGAARLTPRAIVWADQQTPASVAELTPNVARLLHLRLDKGVVVSGRMEEERGTRSELRSAQIRIDGVSAPVSDVAPGGLEGIYRDRNVDVWMRFEPPPEGDRSMRNLWVLGRLRSGVSVSQADSELRAGDNRASEIAVVPYAGLTPEMAAGLERVGTVLGFAGGAVFFIACGNVFSFLLGRAFARSHETSLRIALGAGRWQLAGELLCDSVVISVAGGACGVLLAIWTSHVVPALLFEQDAERLVFVPDLFHTAWWAGACVGITILAGLLPVFAIPYGRPEAVLRRESSGPSKGIRQLRAGLVIAQMTSCCLLVVSAAFLIGALRAALQTSAGQRLGDPILATVQAQPQPDGNPDIGYFDRVEQAARKMRGVSVIGWTGQPPGNQAVWESFRVEPQTLPQRQVAINIDSFTADSLKLFRLPPKAGRLFGFGDAACRVAIVNEAAAERLFARYTVGRTIQEPTGLPVEIIGVVAMRGEGRSRPTIYYNGGEESSAVGDGAETRFRAAIATPLERAELDANVVSARYFEEMGFTLAAGEGFKRGHSMPDECRVAVVNQEAADHYFGGKAVGAAVIDEQGRRTEITGIVHSAALGTFERRVEPAIYFPMSQDTLPRMTLMVRVQKASEAALAELGRRIAAVPGQGPRPVTVKTLETQLSQTGLAPLHIATAILSASAAIALGLSVFGLFGALSDAARQRRREFAVRIALGAQRRHVIYQVLRDGGRLAFTGILAGATGSVVVWRLVGGIAPQGHASLDWRAWLAAPTALMIAVVIASVLPARRALLVNPVTILRDDRAG